MERYSQDDQDNTHNLLKLSSSGHQFKQASKIKAMLYIQNADACLLSGGLDSFWVSAVSLDDDSPICRQSGETEMI